MGGHSSMANTCAFGNCEYPDPGGAAMRRAGSSQVSSSFSLSFVYAVLRIFGGLLLHPYQTLQLVVREKVFLWMSVSPGALLAVLIVLWRLWVLPTLEYWFQCAPDHLYLCQSAEVVAVWIGFFCLYWQLMVSYLTIRFLLVLGGTRS